ncbi:MAG TPA: glycine cleavage system aminomethyltransferase GcvT [Steroidobacteraceae bacterium]|nr:glycine cleavage system aminomethyltransferase GcvT [Steroidobacteraceae bacterium]
MGRRTPLYELHRSLGARLIDFGGWDLPLTYGSQLDEHHAVRKAAGLFDVSHMGIFDVRGRDARALLERLIANDVGKLQAPGKALYGCMLNESGGVVDDLIVYYLDAPGEAHDGLRDGERFRVVVNGATRETDLTWIRSQARGFDAEIIERVDLALIAVQGPEARAQVARVLAPGEAAASLALGRYRAAQIGDLYIARTGYTGEDGFEVMLPAAQAQDVWQRLNALGVVSCGLGARDTLRLEAGLNLYGHDMDASTHPFESRLGWTVALEPRARRFIGREALEAVLARGIDRKLIGLELDGRGVLRAGQRVIAADAGPRAGSGHGQGIVTSGTFSPTLQRSIALARVPAATAGTVRVDVRGKLLEASVVEPPFVHLSTKGSP